MRAMRRLLCILLLLPAFASATSAQTCGGDIPCSIGNREYNVLLPDDWDGTSPLPVMMHFHAFLRRGKTVVNHPRIGIETNPRGVMLIAPSAQNRAWRFWQDDPSDIDFADAVLADLAKQYPVDQSQIFISGFSFGAAMAWRYACARGDKIAGLMTMSGTISQATSCPNPPKQVRHVHGLQDIWMSLPRGQDHDATNAVALWRKAFGCGQGRISEHWLIRANTVATNIVWDNCSGGRKVALDVHSGGHFIPEHWLGIQLDELMGRE